MKTLETIKNDLAIYFAGGELIGECYDKATVADIIDEAEAAWKKASADTMDEVHACDAIIDSCAEAIYHKVNDLLDTSKIDKERLLQELGINIDAISEEELERMANHGRSNLMTAYPVLMGVCFPLQCKLSLRARSDGAVAVVMHPIRHEPNLKEFRGYKFTKEDRKNLLETGNLGHTIEVDSRLLGFRAEVYLSLDRDTNEIVMMKTNAVHVPHSVFGIELNDEQKKMLESGAEVHVSGTNDIGMSCEYLVQVNAERRRFIAKTRS